MTPAPTPAIARPPRFSTLEQIGMAAFTGFAGGLGVLGLKSLLGNPGIIVAFMALGGLVFMQWQRTIEGKDLGILAVLFLLLMLIPALRGGLDWLMVFAIAILSAAAIVAITVLFKLIYQLIARIL
jgi:serine/threonine-protein kinase